MIRKSIGIYLMNGIKAEQTRKLTRNFIGDKFINEIKNGPLTTRVFVCFVCSLFCSFSFCVVNCLNSLEKQEIKTLCSESPCAKYKHERLECRHYSAPCLNIPIFRMIGAKIQTRPA